MSVIFYDDNELPIDSLSQSYIPDDEGGRFYSNFIVLKHDIISRK